MRLVWLGFAAYWAGFALARLDRGRPFFRYADEALVLGGSAVQFVVWAAFGR